MLATAAALLAVGAGAWLLVIRDARMAMSPGASPSLAEAAAFTAGWAVMMTAMMLPSAAPTILLYGTVSRRLAQGGDRVAPAMLFGAVYLVVWGAAGIPVYGAYVAADALTLRWPAAAAGAPYVVAIVLAAAGVYQLTGAKRACLRHCESPLGFLMRRWRSGYRSTLLLAARHSLYCVGCCWALMAVLVGAGATGLRWVAIITLAVLAEKLLPRGRRTAAVLGIALVLLGLAVAVRPSLAAALRGETHGAMEMSR